MSTFVSKIISRAVGLEKFVKIASTIPGWVDPPATREVAVRSYSLSGNPTIVEVGCYQGRSTVLLAGARYIRGNGRVHAIDPFDCSGDDFSIPHYEAGLKASGENNLQRAFDKNVDRAGLTQMVEVHKGTSFEIVKNWNQPIDLLLLDGDQTPHLVRKTYELWLPFLKKGGQFIMHNVGERVYEPGHDGSRILELNEIRPPKFANKKVIQFSLFAIKR